MSSSPGIRGRLDASGYIDFDSTIASGVITGALFDLAVQEFYLVKSRKTELDTNGNMAGKLEGCKAIRQKNSKKEI